MVVGSEDSDGGEQSRYRASTTNDEEQSRMSDHAPSAALEGTADRGGGLSTPLTRLGVGGGTCTSEAAHSATLPWRKSRVRVRPHERRGG